MITLVIEIIMRDIILIIKINKNVIILFYILEVNEYAHTRGVEQHSDFAQVMQHIRVISRDKNILTFVEE